jgi:hypothetical protein
VKLRVTFAVPPGTPAHMIATLLTGQVLEADGYSIDPRLGTLTIGTVRAAEGGAPIRHDIVVYAPGVWRSIADVGAFAEAMPKEAPSEDPRRR